MTEDERAAHLAELRRAFDDVFAAPAVDRHVAPDRQLAIGVGSQDCVVRVAEIGGLFVDRVIVPIPSAAPDLLGIVGLRGEIVPVYALRALLGQPSSASLPRWFVVVHGVGLGFDRFDGYVDAQRDPSRRNVLNLVDIVKNIRARAGAVPMRGE